MAVQTQIQTRRGTAATWTSTNPTLAAGEIGFETDTNKFKIGTGSTAWTALAYAANTSPLTTKGDLYTYSTTNDRLPAGNSGEQLVADSSTSTGLRYQGNFAAGKNKIINGDFGVWQRGTSFTATGYTADRWFVQPASGQTPACSQQTFTPGTAPVAGYEGQFFFRLALSGTPSGSYWLTQRVEDVRTFAGQTVTLSFWAKASSATSALGAFVVQNFGSAGSGEVTVLPQTQYSLTTSWQRFTFTATVPSISGKTIGTNSYLDVRIANGSTTINGINIDYWGLQLEASNTATAFQTATGTLQGELAACQRYYVRYNNSAVNYAAFGVGQITSASSALILISPMVSMRITPTSVDYANLGVQEVWNAGLGAVTALGFESAVISANQIWLSATMGGGGYTTAKSARFIANNSTSGYLGISAEL